MRKGRGKSQKSLDLIDAAHAILQEIYPTTLRSVCYQLFNRNFITSMSMKSELNKVSTQLRWAREQGVIPWEWIVDNEREVSRVSAWENPAAFVETVRHAYRRDRWTDQPEWLEVWSEKGTIGGILAPVLREYGVTFRVMKGYGSATVVHNVAKESLVGDKLLTVLYVGDWDPSGLHMSEVDLPRRIQEYGGFLDFNRVALSEQDITTDLPSFSVEAKRKDPRYRWFRDHHGTRCFELDAISPNVLRDRIEHEIVSRLDLPAWHRHEVVEAAERESLITILDAWPGISGRASKYSAGGADV